MATPLDASQTRPADGGPSFSLANRVARLVWTIVWLLFAAWTPRQFRPWRNLLLRLFGATMAPSADVRGGARVWYPGHLRMGPRALLASGVNCYNMAMVTLGDDVIVSQGAVLCAGTHDVDSRHFQLVTRPITIHRSAWIASEAFVGPGVTVGEGAVLGARAVAFRDLAPWTVYVGNPAAPRRQRQRHD